MRSAISNQKAPLNLSLNQIKQRKMLKINLTSVSRILNTLERVFSKRLSVKLGLLLKSLKKTMKRRETRIISLKPNMKRRI
jgi:hypothetical protein